MLTLSCKITIQTKTDELIFNYVNEIVIDQNADNFTRTAFIKLPQKFFQNTTKNLFEQIEIGQAVKIEIGYYPNFTTRFNGYISKRVPNSPIEIYCEDESFKYKQKFIEPITLTNTTLGAFIDATYGTGEKEIFKPDTKIGTWQVSKLITFLGVLDELRKTFGVSAFWFNDGVLHINQQLGTFSKLVGSFYYDNRDKANIISLANMTYQDATEFSQVVQGVSEQATTDVKGKPNPAIKVFSFYDTDGNIQTQTADDYKGQGNINVFSVKYLTKSELTALTEKRLENLNFTGFRGSFLTFGEPVVNVNDDVQIINNRQTEMNGRYRVKAVKITYGVSSGYRQEIEISKKTGEIVEV